MTQHQQKPGTKPQEQAKQTEIMGPPPATAAEEQPIPIDGFKQILDMLRIADPAFRESLLRRLAAKDKELARELRRDLGI